jgi:hypothetical protein
MKFYRLIAPLAALTLFFSMTALYAFGDRDLYAAIVRLWGIGPGPFGPFLDMHFLTASWQCGRLGIDVFEHNPCDLLGRTFNYSPLWLSVRLFPFEGHPADALAWVCDLLFLLSLFFLPSPRRARDVVLLLLATLSTMVFYAVERANLDIVMFLVVFAAGLLALRSSWIRLAAYPLILLAGLLKYYPLSLLALTFRERPHRFLAVNLVALALTLIFVLACFSDLERALSLIPTGSYFTDLFAAKNLPFGIVQLFGAKIGAASIPMPAPLRFIAYGLYALLVLSCAGICGRISGLAGLRPALAKLTAAESMFLLIGSVLITGCFFAGQSVGYRGISLLFVMPGFLALARHADDKGTRVLGDVTSVVIIFLMWGEFFRTNLLAALTRFHVGDRNVESAWFELWFLRELAWWWLISVMAAVIVDFLGRSEMGMFLSSALKRRRPAAIRVGEARIEDFGGQP